MELKNTWANNGNALTAIAVVQPLGFKTLNDIRSKYARPVMQMTGTKMTMGDMHVDAFGMAFEAMQRTVSRITLDGTDALGNTYANKVLELKTPEDWEAVPVQVGEWLSTVVMEKFFLSGQS